MVLVVTIPGTCSFVSVMRAAAELDVLVSGVVLKVIIYTCGGTVLKQVFLLGCISLVTGTPLLVWMELWIFSV